MEQAFVAWLPDSEFADELTPEQAVGGIGPVLGMIAHGNPRFSATAWTMADLDVFAAFLDDVEATGSELDLQVSDGLQLAAMAWLHFLEETDRWTGTDENLVYCTGVLGLEQLDVPPIRTPSMIELDPVDPEVEGEALAALPLFTRLTTVLEWIGDGVLVTEAGELSVDGTVDVATHLGFELSERPESMYDLSSVSIPWAVLTALGIVATNGDRAEPTDRVNLLSAGDLETLRSALTATIAAELADSLSPDMSMDGGFIVVQLLLAGMTDEPLSPIDPVDDEFDDQQTVIAKTFASALTARLIDDGYLVLVDGLLEVPSPLRPAILAGLPDLSDDDVDDL
ncbi:hypothetical protein [Williamsia soli]|uniref:hypothetical protein n=1 Tax=Williamsia soli TaxID=364929 RepID=UPI001A9D483F|nr:hypothetical protein [Williamsia soli]